MVHTFKWLGTILQLSGSAMVALHLSWSGGVPVMLAGSIIWGAVALARKEWAIVQTWSERTLNEYSGLIGYCNIIARLWFILSSY
jgi:hypothetical protein